MKNFDTVIVGAGLSGLVLGSELKKAGQTVLLIEKSGRCGGPLRTERKDGFLLEHGPNTVLAKPHLMALIAKLGLMDKLQMADKHTSRYIQYHDRLHRLPPGPLSAKGIFRALAEPWAAPSTTTEETVWDFMARRFGEEVAEKLVSPFVSGIWAGDAKILSMKSAFPSITIHERNHGSVIKGLLFGKKKAKAPIKGLISFKGGIQTLVQTLANNLAGGISLNTYIKTISPNPWTMETSQGTVTAKNVVFTLPTYESAELIRPLSAEAAEALREIPYAPIKVIHLGFKRTDISHKLKGFGYLVVPSEKKNILGCLWSSSLFSDRAPEGHVLLTVFMGGMTNPVMATKTNEDLLQFALLDLGPMLGVREAPHFYSVTSYEKAIPQYTRGHSERLEKLTAMEKKYSGLYFAGNYRAGISVSDVVQHAMEMALQLQKSARD